MARSKAIKDALIQVLQAVTYEGEPAFTQVVGHTEGEFDSYPSLRVLPADQSNDKATMSQNDRTISYLVRTHVRLDGGDGFDYMYDLTDAILDALDDADWTDQLSTIDPTIDTYILSATRGDWFDAETAAGVVLMCDINVDVKYSKDL